MQVAKPVGREAAAKKYDMLSALLAHGLASEAGTQRLVLRLLALITSRYNWQRDELTVGQREIARLWCVDERTVKRDMARLRALGWVTVKRQGARGRVSVLGLDLARILGDTRPAWTNIGEDFVSRMTGREVEPAPAPNVVPFRREAVAGDPGALGAWGRMRALLQAEDAGVFEAWLAPLADLAEDGAEEGRGLLRLIAPSRFHATYVRTHLQPRLEAAGRRCGIAGVRIETP